MIAEPYICIQGRHAGEIQWSGDLPIVRDGGNSWVPYADFEREKLRELGVDGVGAIQLQMGYSIGTKYHEDKGGMQWHCYSSASLIGYSMNDYWNDTESNRLLKRAEFLKAVCEKEGIEWLPSTVPVEPETEPFTKTGENHVVPRTGKKVPIKEIMEDLNECPECIAIGAKSCSEHCEMEALKEWDEAKMDDTHYVGYPIKQSPVTRQEFKEHQREEREFRAAILHFLREHVEKYPSFKRHPSEHLKELRSRFLDGQS